MIETISTMVGAISSAVLTAVTIFNVRKTRLEIEKLELEAQEKSGAPSVEIKEITKVTGKLVKLSVASLAVVTLVIIVLSIIFLYSLSQTRKIVEENTQTIADLENRNMTLTTGNETLQEKLKRSLDTFAEQYREKVNEAERAIDNYKAFDTPENRNELGSEFDQRHSDLQQEAVTKLSALVEHVEGWKPVQESFGKLLNGDVEALRQALVGNQNDEAFRSFNVISENIDSKISRLQSALELAASGE